MILDCVHTYQVTVLLAPTGSCKSTTVIQYLADRYLGCRIVCSQPRRLCVQKIASQVIKQIGGEIGQEVGIDLSKARRTKGNFLLYLQPSGKPFSHRICYHWSASKLFETRYLTQIVHCGVDG